MVGRFRVGVCARGQFLKEEQDMNQFTDGDHASCGGASCIWRKASLRLVPLLIVCYLYAFLDRINIAFPANALVVMAAPIALGVGAWAALLMFWQLPQAFTAPVLLVWGGLTSSFGNVTSLTAHYLMVLWDTVHSSALDLYL